MSIRGVIGDAADRLQEAGISSAPLDARLLMQQALGYDHATLIRHSDNSLAQDQQERFEQLLARRMRREPLSHITGYREFWKHRFLVSPEVLDPRPDSETLIEAVLRYLPDKGKTFTMLDLGVGSGCLLLSLLGEYPNARGVGVDISEAALAVARQNAEQLALEARCDFLQDNWGKTLHPAFDMIISNPPYIADVDMEHLEPEVGRYEPRLALSGGQDGLAAYRAIALQLKRLLRKRGLAVVELGAGQHDAVARIMCEAGLERKESAEDISGIDRALIITH